MQYGTTLKKLKGEGYYKKQVADEVKKKLLELKKKLKKSKVSAIKNLVTDATQADPDGTYSTRSISKITKGFG